MMYTRNWKAMATLLVLGLGVIGVGHWMGGCDGSNP